MSKENNARSSLMRPPLAPVSEKQREVLAALTNIKSEITELVQNGCYKEALKLVNRTTGPFMINKSSYDIYALCPYDTSVSAEYKIEYVNASFIDALDMRWIACQHPKAKFYNRFYEFLKKAEPGLIICLTPEEGYVNETKVIASETINHNGEPFLVEEDFIIDDTPIKRVRCLCWPDHSAISADDLEFLYFYVNQLIKKIEPKTVIIHCIAGVGRSGTLLMHMILKNSANISVDYFTEVFLYLRACRPYTVENVRQFELLANVHLKAKGTGD